MTPIISVVITTHNRASLLKNCLESLCSQTYDQALYEIIVVDNCSTDDTWETVKAFDNQCRIYYFVENQLGMNFARNLGLKESQGEYVAYIDDDAKAAPNWLEVAARELTCIVPVIDCLGGPIFPYYTSPKPEWFKDRYEIRRDWKTSRYLKTGKSFSGSNMIWRKEVLFELGGFDTDHGVIGDELRLGGETIVFSKIWDAFKNPQLYYSPDLLVYHWVPPQKMKVNYRLKRTFANGQTMGKIETRNFNLFQKIKYFFNHGKWSVLNIGRAFIHVGRHHRVQNWVIEELGPILEEFGKAIAILRIYPRIRQEPI